jgi:hypothetical protein
MHPDHHGRSPQCRLEGNWAITQSRVISMLLGEPATRVGFHQQHVRLGPYLPHDVRRGVHAADILGLDQPRRVGVVQRLKANGPRLAAWGNTGGPADINGDGIVDVLDLSEVLGAWGPC